MYLYFYNIEKFDSEKKKNFFDIRGYNSDNLYNINLHPDNSHNFKIKIRDEKKVLIFLENKYKPPRILNSVPFNNIKINKKHNIIYEKIKKFIISNFNDITKKNYKIVVTDETTVYVIEKNEVQFKYDLFETKDLNYQYYYFGGNNEMLSILNRSKNNILIFNLKTNSISKINIPSDQLISILYYDYKKEFEIYSILNNKLLKNRLKN